MIRKESRHSKVGAIDMVKRGHRTAEPTRWKAINLIVVPGKGTLGTKDPEPTTVAAEIHRLTGIAKVPGSMNLRSPRSRIWLRRRAGSRWSGGLLYRGRVEGIDVAFTKRGGFGASPRLFHVYSDRHLKTALSLADGSSVLFEVPASILARFRFAHELVYALRLLRSRVLSHFG